MSKCAACKREMPTADGCVLVPVVIKHRDKIIKKLDPIPFGKETRFDTVEAWERCHDCGCKKGEFHHIGCDWEECPNCRRQMLMCGGDCGEVPS